MKSEVKSKPAKAPKYQLNIFEHDAGFTAQFLVDGKVVQEITDPNSYPLIYSKFEPTLRLARFEHP